MNKLHRKVSLENFRSRVFGCLPVVGGEEYDYAYEGYNEYGKIPYDVIISDKSDIRKNYTNEKVLRLIDLTGKLDEIKPSLCNGESMPYMNMLKLYRFIKSFGEKSEYYIVKNDGKDLCFKPVSHDDNTTGCWVYTENLPYKFYEINSDRLGIHELSPYPATYEFYEYRIGGKVEYTFDEDEIPVEYVYIGNGGSEMVSDEKPEGVHFTERERQRTKIIERYLDSYYIQEDLDKYSDGLFVCVNEDAEYLISKFGSTDECSVDIYKDAFVEMCELLYNNNILTVVKKDFIRFFAPPSIQLKIYIDSEYTDLGCYKPYYFEWEKNREYNGGTVVLYGNRYYMLSGDIDFKHKSKTTPDADEAWDEVYSVSEDEHEVKGYCISKIKDFKSNQTNTIDDNAMELPFYYINEKVSTTLNVMPDGARFDKDKVSVIYEVVFTDENMENEVLADSNFINENNELVYYRIIPETGFVRIKYCKYASVKEDRTLDLETGIHYEDIFHYEVKKYNSFKYGGKEYNNVAYIDIDYNVSNLTDDLVSTVKPLSKFVFKQKNVVSEIGLQLFKDDKDMLIHDIDITDNVVVDRGESTTANAYERHMILGEIMSFEDMVEFKNDYFKLNDN